MRKKIKNLKIGIRLKIIFTVIVIAFIAFMAIAIVSIVKISKDLKLFYAQSYKVTSAALKSKEAFESIQKTIYEIVAMADTENTEILIENLNDYSNIFNQNFKILKDGFSGNVELIYDIENKLSESVAIRKKILEYLNSDSKLSLQILKTSYCPIIESIQNSLASIVNESSQQATLFIDMSENAKVNTIVFLTILFLMLILYIEYVYFHLIKSIVHPMEKLDRVATQIADGNLKVQIDYECKDEIGNLTKNMRYTIDVINLYISNISDVLSDMANKNLNTEIEIDYIGDFEPIKESMKNILASMSFTLGNIKDVAKKVAIGSENMAQASQIIAEGATDQSSSVEQLVATFNTVAEQIGKTADDAKLINTKSSESIQFVNTGNEYMQKLLEYMDKLSHHTQKISKITKVVDDISKQTNMLSLNAEIEAARAGQSGRGFAVVADEIGKLANETAKSTKDISDLIEEAVIAVKEGLSLTQKTASIFKRIVSVSGETDNLIENITLACTNQSNSINEILAAIEQISDVVQSNSAIAQQTSASSEQLLSQSELVAKLLNEFQLPQN